MTDTEIANLLARQVAGTNGTDRPLPAEHRPVLERFARRLLVHPPDQDAFLPLRQEAFDRHGVTEQDAPGLRKPASDDPADDYLTGLKRDGVGVLTDAQLVGILTADAFGLEFVSDVILDAYGKPHLAPEWRDAAMEFVPGLSQGPPAEVVERCLTSLRERRTGGSAG